MKISKYFLISAGIFLAISYYVSARIVRPRMFISKQDSTINFNSKLIQFFHFGQKRLLSSIMWVSTILESDLDHYKMKDMNSWMYLRFKTISDLEPKFYENYHFGGVYLSIVKDDLLGASEIYERGLKEFPNDYFLLKNAAFHYEFEVGDSSRAYKIYSKLKSHPSADSQVLAIAARLETEFGSKQVALELLQGQYKKIVEKDSFLAIKLRQNLYALKAEMDLECLNSHKANCSQLDYDDTPYLFKNGKYQSQKSWTPLRLKHRNSK